MAVGPVNYWDAAGGQAGLIDPSMALTQGLLRQLRMRQADAQVRTMEAALSAGQQQQQRQADFSAAADAAIAGGADPQSIARLFVQFPEFKDELAKGYNTLDAAQKQATLRGASDLYYALDSGNIDLARQKMQAQVDAAKAKGDVDPTDEAVLADLRSDDPQRHKRAKLMAGAILRTAVGPDKWASATGALNEEQGDFTLSPGGRRFDREGNLIASAPFAPRAINVGEGDTIVEYQPGGGGPASGGAGSGAPRSVRNNNPGNLRDSPFTRRLPGYQGVDADGFAMFDTAENGAGAQTALLKNYMSRGFDTVEKIIGRWAPPSDGNDTDGYVRAVSSALGVQPGDKLTAAQVPALASAIARVEGGPGVSSGGGARVIAQGAPKASARPLTAAEKAQWGLPADVAYKMGPDGPVLIGGQDTRTNAGRPVPDSTAKRIEGEVAVRDSLQRAISGFRDDFAGNRLTGGLENSLQAVLDVGTPGQRQWWADFQAADNQIRNQLFGSALTEHEKKAYEGTTISPRMTPKTIRANLARRAQIVQGALARRQRFLKANNYNADAVDALFATDPLSGGAPVQIRSVQEYEKLAKGTPYIDPQGNQRVKR